MKSYVEHFQDCLAASATAIRSNEDLSAATPLTFTLDAQIAALRKQIAALSEAAKVPLDKDFQALEDLVESEKKESKEKNRKRVTSSQG